MSRRGEWMQMKKEYDAVTPPPEGIQQVQKAIVQARGETRRKRRLRRIKCWSAGIAAAAVLVILVPNVSISAAYAMSSVPVLGPIIKAVTFREYQAESDNSRYLADVNVPKLEAADGLPASEEELDRINRQIEEIAHEMIADFETAMGTGEGYEELLIRYEILDTSKDSFTLKLMTYIGAGSGYEKDYYYTLDLRTGKQLTLADLFADGADFITPISENIKEQMRSRMAADADVCYWVDLEDDLDAVQEWAFEAIAEDQSFYIDQNGQLVITFSEGDVAPMYMGCDQFTIPDAVVENIKERQ